MIVTHCTINRYNPDIFLRSSTHILTDAQLLVPGHFALVKTLFSVCASGGKNMIIIHPTADWLRAVRMRHY